MQGVAVILSEQVGMERKWHGTLDQQRKKVGERALSLPLCGNENELGLIHLEFEDDLRNDQDGEKCIRELNASCSGRCQRGSPD